MMNTPKVIPFNQPFLSGDEETQLKAVLASGKWSGNGVYTEKVHRLLENYFKTSSGWLTTSCTHALELAAMLLDVGPGDEVLLPSYTFVSTANAFANRGAKLVFVDSHEDHPNLNANLLESLITPRTKVIVPVHYAGHACDMGLIQKLATKHQLAVVEDAAQGVGGNWNGTQPLGSIGDFGAVSFHDTKNISCGEGGALLVNSAEFKSKVETAWEKGTNRAAFLRGEVEFYEWVSSGSSYLPSELTAAMLYVQLSAVEEIQAKRCLIYDRYADGLADLGDQVQLPVLPKGASNAGHLFYLVLEDQHARAEFQRFLKEKGIQTASHYLSLHQSRYFRDEHDGRALPNSDRYTNGLVRLPLYTNLSEADQRYVIEQVKRYFS